MMATTETDWTETLISLGFLLLFRVVLVQLCEYFSGKDNIFYQKQRQNCPELLLKCRICPMEDFEQRTSLMLTQSRSRQKLDRCLQSYYLQLLLKPTKHNKLTIVIKKDNINVQFFHCYPQTWSRHVDSFLGSTNPSIEQIPSQSNERQCQCPDFLQ